MNLSERLDIEYLEQELADARHRAERLTRFIAAHEARTDPLIQLDKTEYAMLKVQESVNDALVFAMTARLTYRKGLMK